MRLKTCAAFLCLALSSLSGHSQSYIGYGYDNYAGVNALILNPGTISDSKYKVHVNIFSVSTLAGNNAYQIDRSKLFSLAFSNLEDGNGYYKTKTSDYKYMYENTDVLGPGATITLTPKDAIGLTTRMRTIGNVYNLGNPLFQLLGKADPSFFNMDIINRSLQAKTASFGEAGFSYGRVLLKNKKSELKAGVTGKYILGLAYASLSSGQMTVNIDPAQYINKLDADITTQYTPNLDGLGAGSFRDVLKGEQGHGWGLDIGIVYEYKPTGVADYKLRMGLSITDLGSVQFHNSPNARHYTLNADGHNTSELNRQAGEDMSAYFSRLQTQGLLIDQGGAPTVNVSLPTALRFNTDYRIYKRLFINGDILVNMVSTTNVVTPNYVSTATVTPRLEKKWFSIYSPVSYNANNQLNWGAGLRIGNFFVGSGSVLSSLLKSRIQAADVHIGFTIPIYQHDNKHSKSDTVYRDKNLTHDKDGDGVVDEKDECPDSAGPIALIGCPDKDGDGVADKHDKCPDVPGNPKFQGCPVPDSDGDSVDDLEDRCPLVKGLKSNFGCPPINPALIATVNGVADRVFFVRAKATIEKVSHQELDRVVVILQSDSTLRLRIEGHTDNEGTDARNEKLSIRRAKAVEHYLETKGIDPKRLEFRAFGSKKPIATNSTREGMAQNRRVEMILMNYPKRAQD
jgi:outer membrane protein OmpA-like peptidoglycan-associated protein